jgi:hypothetical protein
MLFALLRRDFEHLVTKTVIRVAYAYVVIEHRRLHRLNQWPYAVLEIIPQEIQPVCNSKTAAVELTNSI